VHLPRIILLDDSASSVKAEILIESRSNKVDEKMKPKGDFKQSNKSSQKSKEKVPPHGALSSLYLTAGNGYNELFVGYESGAVGAFRLILNDKAELSY